MLAQKAKNSQHAIEKEAKWKLTTLVTIEKYQQIGIYNGIKEGKENEQIIRAVAQE
jgi:hypothetical protein